MLLLNTAKPESYKLLFLHKRTLCDIVNILFAIIKH